jgi:hypothetical protein
MFIATAYYISPAVRTYWEKRYEGPILWFGTTLEGVAEHLDRLSSPTSSKAPFPTAGAPAAAPAAPVAQAAQTPAVPAARSA